MESTGSEAWSFAVILGTLGLGAVLAYGAMHFRKRGRGPTAPRNYDQSSGQPTTESVSQTGEERR